MVGKLKTNYKTEVNFSLWSVIKSLETWFSQKNKMKNGKVKIEYFIDYENLII